MAGFKQEQGCESRKPPHIEALGVAPEAQVHVASGGCRRARSGGRGARSGRQGFGLAQHCRRRGGHGQAWGDVGRSGRGSNRGAPRQPGRRLASQAQLGRTSSSIAHTANSMCSVLLLPSFSLLKGCLGCSATCGDEDHPLLLALIVIHRAHAYSPQPAGAKQQPDLLDLKLGRQGGREGGWRAAGAAGGGGWMGGGRKGDQAGGHCRRPMPNATAGAGGQVAAIHRRHRHVGAHST